MIFLVGVHNSDLMPRLTASQMTAFKKRLNSLDDALPNCDEDVAVSTADDVLRS